MKRSRIMIIIVFVVGILLLIFAARLFETNNQGEYQVKQAFISGTMTARMVPGTYGQWLGMIETYRANTTVGFGQDQEGDISANLDSIPVIFNDGSKAKIAGLIRVQLPKTEHEMINLKKEFAGGYKHFIEAGVVPIVENAVKLGANLRSAQDAYTTLALFQQSVDDQLQNGIYVTQSERKEIVNATGDTEVRQVTVISRDSSGVPLRQPNRLQELGCDVTNCVIDVPGFDQTVEDMIAKRKDEAMKTELAKQAALRAQQDAITAEEQGKADVAKAKYAKEVIKVEEVTEASKRFEVEEYAAKQAIETAKKIVAEGDAKAAANRALVSAGLTPQQEMEMTIKIADVVSKNIAAAPTPQVVITGGEGGSSGAEEALKVFGAERALELIKKVNAGIK